jgi:hypothetical protein
MGPRLLLKECMDSAAEALIGLARLYRLRKKLVRAVDRDFNPDTKAGGINVALGP